MQRLDNGKHARLLATITETLRTEFQEKFVYQDIHYQVGAPAVLDTLVNEVKSALAWKLLTPTQRELIEAASDEDIDQMGLRIAGGLNIVAGADINLVLGHGLAPNAIAKVYFEALDIKMASFADDYVLKSKKKNAAIVAADQPPTVYPASHDKLNGDFFNNRRRPIQLEFCLGLLASAKPDHIQKLKVEAALPRSYGILNMMAGHQDLFRKLQSNPDDTASLDIYKKTLEQIGNVYQQVLKH